MTFAAPELLIALALVPLALIGYLLIQRRRTRYAVRFTNVDLLRNIAPRTPSWRRHLPPILYLAALAALAVALARPAMVVAVPKEQATVVLAIDVSRSMEATDVSPTRLDAAVAAATTFVDKMPAKFKVGLVAFSTSARLVVPPTEDHQKV
jgi:Ca-activated chloride channel family protein